MPHEENTVKICAHYAAKVPGSQEYSSHGWSLTIEAEPPSDIREDRDKLAEYSRRLFAEVRARVEDEIANLVPKSRSRARTNGAAHRNDRSNGFPRNGHANGRSGRNGSSSTASPKQVNFLRSLANAAGIGYRGLDDLARNEFGKDVRDLTKKEASALIDELRE